MKLYRTEVLDDNGRVTSTHFRTSLVKAKRAMPIGPIRISEVVIRTKLCAGDFIGLLECDAPGSQEIMLTPIDLILEAKEVFKRGIESHGTG